jgi:hypothetical protein
MRYAEGPVNFAVVKKAVRLALLAGLFSFATQAQQLTPSWVELGENGAAIARVIVTSPSDCPSLKIDGSPSRMSLREPTPHGFRPVCELAIPATAKSASLNGKRLHLPRRNPSRIVALGDTGCRIKGAQIQDCNHPDKWPFLQLAMRASREKADLVIHVGDYLYRESPCPAGANAMCGGAPSGDNWDAWNADFFKPAAKLLAASPWAFSRGNHEDCLRSWRGFFYYLDPRPWTAVCQKYGKPYVITLGAFQLAMIDSSAVQESSMNLEQVIEYSSQFSSLHLQNAWLADHHPFWGLRPDGNGGAPAPISVPLLAAWLRVKPQGIDLILSGHIHLFEFVDFRNYPPQLVAGDGGTDMDRAIGNPTEKMQVDDEPMILAQNYSEFGYSVFTKRNSSWRLTFKNLAGRPIFTAPVRPAASGAVASASN